MLEGCWALNWCLLAAGILQMELALKVWWWEVGEREDLSITGTPIKPAVTQLWMCLLLQEM